MSAENKFNSCAFQLYQSPVYSNYCHIKHFFCQPPPSINMAALASVNTFNARHLVLPFTGQYVLTAAAVHHKHHFKIIYFLHNLGSPLQYFPVHTCKSYDAETLCCITCRWSLRFSLRKSSNGPEVNKFHLIHRVPGSTATLEWEYGWYLVPQMARC